MDAFLNDTAPDAYQKVVHRLMRSPHFGEHLAVGWLDAARYADTHGYQLDVPRTAWPYRDWVIAAFNRNLPFDQFVTWQLAGDLLPSPSRDQLVATCFNRLHPQNQEGGIVEGRVPHRVRRRPRQHVWEGVSGPDWWNAPAATTTNTTRFPQKDYYQLFAFFNNVNEAGQVPFYGESSPTVLLTSDSAAAQLRSIQQQLSPLATLLNPAHARYDAEFTRWLSVARQKPDTVVSRRAWLGRYAFEDDSLKRFVNAVNPKQPAVVSGDGDKPPLVVAGRFGRGRAVNGDGNIDLGKNLGFFERNQPFTVGLWVNLRKKGLHGPVFSRSNGLDNGNRGYECLLLPDGTLSFNLNQNFPDNAIDLHTAHPLPVGRWVHVLCSYDGSGSAAGTRILLDGKPTPTRVYADNLKKSLLYGPKHTNVSG